MLSLEAAGLYRGVTAVGAEPGLQEGAGGSACFAFHYFS